MQEQADNIIIVTVAITLLSMLLVGFLVTILFFHQNQLLYYKNINQIKIEHEKNILKTQLEIQETTFDEISREIHDNIGLSLTLAKLNLNTIPMDTLNQSLPLIQSSIDLISKSIKDLNDLSKSMKADIVGEVGFIKSLEHQLEKLESTGFFTIRYEIFGEPVYMDSQKELVLYRIVQETFNNILKHACAKAIHIILTYGTKEFSLKIRDDGKGFTEEEINRKKQLQVMSGLNNIKKRVQLIGGRCSIDSHSNKGTTVLVDLVL